MACATAQFFMEGSSIASALRGLRLLRILKMAKSWEALRRIVSTLFETVPGLASMAMLFSLFLFIYAILGMQLYRDRFPEGSRRHFDNFPVAVVTVFQLLMAENDVIYNGIQARGYLFSLPYFLSFIILGIFVMITVNARL